ncbi:AI-2E family transporter, partial [Anaerospora hongkongensis]
MVISKRTIRISLLVTAIIATVYFIWSVRSGLYPFIIALFLAYLLNPAVCYLEHKGLKRTVAILVLYILVFSTIFFVGARGIPLIIRELENFGRELPYMVEKGEELIQFIQSQYQNSVLPYSLRVAIDNALIAVQYDIQQFIADAVNALIGLVSHSIGLVITPILAFYLLHDWYEIKEKLLQLIPVRWHNECI